MSHATWQTVGVWFLVSFGLSLWIIPWFLERWGRRRSIILPPPSKDCERNGTEAVTP
jgi:hypothetical protein